MTKRKKEKKTKQKRIKRQKDKQTNKTKDKDQTESCFFVKSGQLRTLAMF